MADNTALSHLAAFVEATPKHRNDAASFLQELSQGKEKLTEAKILQKLALSKPDLYKGFCAHLKEKNLARVFQIYDKIPDHLIRQMESRRGQAELAHWSDTLKRFPQYTLPLQDPSKAQEFVRHAKYVWEKQIYGCQDIFKIMIRHGLEYMQEGKTSAILLEGPPGIGKTTIAKAYADILQLPCSFISAPSASMGRGLAGAPNLYSGANVGCLAEALIKSGVGNPVLCIDEIEKASRGGHNTPDIQNELLAAMDESNLHWRDHFLEFDMDASHIPYIFTANELGTIDPPLLDRMDVIHMSPPDKEVLGQITKKTIIPKALHMYNTDRIHFPEEEADNLVNLLWQEGNQGCRPYQKAVSMLVGDAYLEMIFEDKDITIGSSQVRKAVEECSQGHKARRIGFR